MTDILQIRIKPKTLDQVDEIKKKVNALSRSDAVRRAVEISDLLVNAVEEGDKVIIESKDGKQKQLLIAGLSK